MDDVDIESDGWSDESEFYDGESEYAEPEFEVVCVESESGIAWRDVFPAIDGDESWPEEGNDDEYESERFEGASEYDEDEEDECDDDEGV